MAGEPETVTVTRTFFDEEIVVLARTGLSI